MTATITTLLSALLAYLSYRRRSFLGRVVDGVIKVPAAISHIVQSNHTETERRIYRWWAYGTGWIGQVQQQGEGVFGARNWFTLTFGWLIYPYLWLSRAMKITWLILTLPSLNSSQPSASTVRS